MIKMGKWRIADRATEDRPASDNRSCLFYGDDFDSSPVGFSGAPNDIQYYLWAGYGRNTPSAFAVQRTEDKNLPDKVVISEGSLYIGGTPIESYIQSLIPQGEEGDEEEEENEGEGE